MGDASGGQAETRGGRAPSGDITTILRAWSAGDQAALERLTPIVYEELRRLARRSLRRERPGHSLQASALVNEAYLRLVDYKRMQWQDRAHFFAVSAQLMQRIRGRAERGGTAAVLDVSPVTVSRDWSSAKAWLYRELAGGKRNES